MRTFPAPRFCAALSFFSFHYGNAAYGTLMTKAAFPNAASIKQFGSAQFGSASRWNEFSVTIQSIRN
jgi:hypothetical protein